MRTATTEAQRAVRDYVLGLERDRDNLAGRMAGWRAIARDLLTQRDRYRDAIDILDDIRTALEAPRPTALREMLEMVALEAMRAERAEYSESSTCVVPEPTSEDARRVVARLLPDITEGR